jgi:hypothetical protein
MTVASGAYHAAKASPSPSAHARDVWANTARIALSWLVPAAVVLLVVMVFPFWFSCRQAVAADLVRLGGLRGYLAPAGDAVMNRRKAATSSRGLRWRRVSSTATRAKFRPSSSRNVVYRSPVGWVWCSSS